MGVLSKASVVFLCQWLILSSANAATVAAFKDPSPGGAFPLFTVDLVNKVVQGGWQDSQLGLNLEYAAGVYPNSFFTMSDLPYSGDVNGGVTGSGTIKFYADNSNPLIVDPVFQIDFDQAKISFYSLAGSNVFALMADGVVFSGLLVGTPAGTPANLEEESFSFSFSNQTWIQGNPNAGYTSTASFTSSATPEPGTAGLLLLGAYGLRFLKRRPT